jgi:hypothetical protein
VVVGGRGGDVLRSSQEASLAAAAPCLDLDPDGSGSRFLENRRILQQPNGPG